MSETQIELGQRIAGRRINSRNVVVWISVGVLVGTEVFGAALAGAWAMGGLLELPPTIQWILYALALVAATAVMVPFMKQAARVDPLWRTGERQP